MLRRHASGLSGHWPAVLSLSAVSGGAVWADMFGGGVPGNYEKSGPENGKIVIVPLITHAGDADMQPVFYCIEQRSRIFSFSFQPSKIGIIVCKKFDKLQVLGSLLIKLPVELLVRVLRTRPLCNIIICRIVKHHLHVCGEMQPGNTAAVELNCGIEPRFPANHSTSRGMQQPAHSSNTWMTEILYFDFDFDFNHIW